MRYSSTTLTTAFLVTIWAAIGTAQAIDRTVLPLKEPYIPPITTVDARDAKKPPLFQVRAPKDAPNVLIILIDDLGFGGTSTFGGVIPTPAFDRLANNGLMFNQFHSTAVCSPTRLALRRSRLDIHSAQLRKSGEVVETISKA